MNKGFWIVLVVVITGLVGLFVLTGGSSENSNLEKIENPSEISQLDITKGTSDAPIEIIEYANFQCPHCADYHPVIKQVLKEQGENVEYAFRHFLIPSLSRALPAHRAAEAARLQGKFWEMQDLLFDRQTEWVQKGGSEIFISYAEELDLDTEKFRNDLTSSEVQNAIDRTYQSGQDLGVNSTPTYYLNGEKISPPPNVQSFNKLIEEALSEAELNQKEQ